MAEDDVKDQPTKILYILGAGRSGSTVLDILLGSSPELVSTGELIHLQGRGWINNEYCACGERVNSCPFWSQVKTRWLERCGPGAIQTFLARQKRFERIRVLFSYRTLERDPELQEYLRQLDALLTVVLEVSGKQHIVDSSKKHARALLMSLLPQYELYVVHLVRDSRGVAWSKAKSLRKDEEAGVQSDQHPVPVSRTARDWLLTNLLCSALARRFSDRYLRVRYEDFVVEPEAVLRTIGRFAGLDVEIPISNLLADAPLAPGHTVAGNRLRMNGAVRLKPDLEWKEKLTPHEESTVWRWTGMLLRAYGYQR